MVRETVDVLVARPPQAVFDRLADVRRLPEWNGPVSAAMLADGSSLAVGCRVVVTVTIPPGFDRAVTVVVTEFDRPTRLCFETRTRVRLRSCLDVKPVSGGTKVIETLSAETGPVSGLVVDPLVRWLARTQAENLQQLKAQLESSGSG